jgi:hypothetical protein
LANSKATAQLLLNRSAVAAPNYNTPNYDVLTRVAFGITLINIEILI